MMHYDTADRVLTIRKKDVVTLPVDLPREANVSYKRYIEHRIFEDVQYLAEALSRVLRLTVTITSVRVERDDRDTMIEVRRHRPTMVRVFGDFNVSTPSGISNYIPDVEIAVIPAMENDGILSDGKALTMRLSSAEDLTYDDKKDQLVVTLPTRHINFNLLNTDVTMQGQNDKKTSLLNLIVALLRADNILPEQGYQRILCNIFSSTLFRNSINSKSDLLSLTMVDEADKFAGTVLTFADYVKSEWMKLGNTRKTLNQHFSLFRCLGSNLGLDVYLPLEGEYIRKGTVLDKRTIDRLEANKINKIYLWSLPLIAGQTLAQDYRITRIPKGTKVTPLICTLKPQLAKFAYTPVDVVVDKMWAKGTVIESNEQVSLMFTCGVTEIYTTRGPYPYVPYHEVLTNHTTPIHTLYPNELPEEVELLGYTASDYISTEAIQKYGKDGLSDPALVEAFLPPHFTAWDLCAMYSFATGIKYLPEVHRAYHRDLDFCKRVDSVAEIFSESFRYAVNKMLATPTTLRDILTTKQTNALTERLYQLKAIWRSYINRSTLLRSVEATNPLSHLTYPRRVATNNRNASVSQRDVALGQYGKLCPYETPAGEKLGLLNTMASSARIINGRLACPYHPIEKRDGKAYVSRKVVWLNSLEEIGYRIGDLLSLKQDGGTFTSPIIPTNVLALVPAPLSIRERVVVDTVSSDKLDFVNVSPEQSLSPSVALIPFVGADDGARVSFAASMLKQAIPILGAEAPYVVTDGYKDIFPESSSTYVVRSPINGTVTALSATAITIDNTVIHIKETQVRNDTIIALDYRVAVGDEVTKGQLLADTIISRDGYFTPGCNALVAYLPWYGRSYEDAYVVSDSFAEKCTSIAVHHTDMERFNSPTRLYQMRPVARKAYLKAGDVAYEVVERDAVTQQQVGRPKRATIQQHHDGLLYTASSQTVRDSTLTLRATTIGFEGMHEGDKLTGRHGNKGVSSWIAQQSTMPCFLNGKVIDICANPCSVPSRMNIGQILEGHLGFVGYLLDVKINSNSFNGATEDDIKMLLSFVHDACNGVDLSSWKGTVPDTLIDRAHERMPYLQEWAGCFNKNGTATLVNQVTGKTFEFPITFGVPHFVKLSHRVAHKINMRGCTGKYKRILKQPARGQANQGGQRLGDFEFAILASHGASAWIREALNEKSDNVELRQKSEDPEFEDSITGADMIGTSTRTVELLRYDLEAIGFKTTVAGGSDISLDAVTKRENPRRFSIKRNRTTPDVTEARDALDAFRAEMDCDGYEEVVLAMSNDSDAPPFDPDPTPSLSHDPYASVSSGVSHDPYAGVS